MYSRSPACRGRLASPRLASPRLASPCLASPRLASPRLTPRLISPRLAPRLALPVASPRLASPRLASPRLALPCLASPRLFRLASPFTFAITLTPALARQLCASFNLSHLAYATAPRAEGRCHLLLSHLLQCPYYLVLYYILLGVLIM